MGNCRRGFRSFPSPVYVRSEDRRRHGGGLRAAAGARGRPGRRLLLRHRGPRRPGAARAAEGSRGPGPAQRDRETTGLAVPGRSARPQAARALPAQSEARFKRLRRPQKLEPWRCRRLDTWDAAVYTLRRWSTLGYALRSRHRHALTTGHSGCVTRLAGTGPVLLSSVAVSSRLRFPQ